ncbi:AI-2E family transporter [Paeniglutamicibacter psychrophenolicus]|uniref:AI-2E family transporter n=1 Tax=Paeniglutamicibacter psychrophenolicus TaxID=257454 RepID=UPI00278291DF|nr:AI-2E family transporter [Paeniglutamicibacter psychrophenolicus]MDQ0094077.1 putative PurR-regulated permease PerM [Paeniglutamicibacter psychrophenolicus]
MKPTFRSGFVVTLGVLAALGVGAALISLTYVLTLVFVALFVALGLDPVVGKLGKLGLNRVRALLCVVAVLLVFAALVLALVVPLLVTEGRKLLVSLPSSLEGVESQGWFIELNGTLGGALVPGVDWLQRTVADPAVWLAVGNGALKAGFGVANGVFGVLFVTMLTMYFVIGLEPLKNGLYDLVPASRRDRVRELGEEIAGSVGSYLSGMAILAALNATFTFVLLSVLQVPFAAVLGVLALPITMIPLVGSVISTAIVTVVTLFHSPGTALVVLAVMLAYMQVEAYVLTPRVVGKAIRIPASMVLIGAMAGGTLAGLLGALVACPASAAILLILKKVVVPAQAER